MADAAHPHPALTAISFRRYVSGATDFVAASIPPSPHPWRLEARHLRVDRARLFMRPREVASAHEELARDLATGEREGLLEELDPFLLCPRMMLIEPLDERSVTRAKRD